VQKPKPQRPDIVGHYVDGKLVIRPVPKETKPFYRTNGFSILIVMVAVAVMVCWGCQY
jgi:hypothetical protein